VRVTLTTTEPLSPGRQALRQAIVVVADGASGQS
jgi:hypothetical protein